MVQSVLSEEIMNEVKKMYEPCAHNSLWPQKNNRLLKHVYAIS